MPHVQKSHEYTCYQSSPRNGNYNSFIELCKRVLTLTSISGWNLQELKDRIILTRSNHLLLLPEIELMIAKSLGCTIWIFRWRLLEDHDLYTNSLRATTKIISNLVKDLEKMHTCPGVKPTERCRHVLPHVILKLPGDPLFDDPGPSFPHEEFGGLIIVHFCWRWMIYSEVVAPPSVMLKHRPCRLQTVQTVQTEC